MTRSITLLALAPLCAGCASILSKSSYPVTIDSAPRNASFVILDGDGAELHSGTTPETIALDSDEGFFNGADYTVIFREAGYQECVTPLSAKLDPWYVGNILFGGLIGVLIVDPLTGAMWKLDDELLVELTPAQG